MTGFYPKPAVLFACKLDFQSSPLTKWAGILQKSRQTRIALIHCPNYTLPNHQVLETGRNSAPANGILLKAMVTAVPYNKLMQRMMAA